MEKKKKSDVPGDKSGRKAISPSPEVKTIIITDDHPMIAQGLASIIHQFTPYKVIAQVADGKALMKKLKTVQPDMVLLDINMPHLNGIETAQLLTKRYANLKVIIITSYGEEVLRQLKVNTHVHGYISKMSDGNLIIQTLTAIMNGDDRGLQAHENIESEAEVIPDISKLSNRELEILRLIKQGLSTPQISVELFLSPHTIKTHRKNIVTKLGLTTPNGLVKWVHENIV